MKTKLKQVLILVPLVPLVLLGAMIYWLWGGVRIGWSWAETILSNETNGW